MRSRSGRGSTSGVLKFWALGTRNIDSQYSLRRHVLICMVKACYDYRSHTDKRKRSRSGHKRSLYVTVVI